MCIVFEKKSAVIRIFVPPHMFSSLFLEFSVLSPVLSNLIMLCFGVVFVLFLVLGVPGISLGL